MQLEFLKKSVITSKVESAASVNSFIGFVFAHAAIFNVRVNKHAMDLSICFTYTKPVIVLSCTAKLRRVSKAT